MTRVQRNLVMVVLASAVAAAVGYPAYEQYRLDEIKKNEANQEKRLFRFGKIDVVQGRLQAGATDITFVRDDKGFWQLTEPMKTPADAEAINGALSHFTGIKQDAMVAEDVSPAQLADYGLDDPEIRMSVTLEDGSRHELLVGARHPMAPQYYITDGEKKVIASAAATFHSMLARETFAFRDKKIVPWAVDLITSAALLEEGRVRFKVALTDDRWTVTDGEGRTMAGDPSAIRRLLLVLTRDLRAESFPTDTFDPADPDQKKRYGFDEHSFTLVVTNKRGEEVSLTVGHAGEQVEVGGPYGHIQGSGTVVGVYENFPSDMDKPATHFRDRRLSMFDVDEAHRLELQFPGGKWLKVQREGTEANGEPRFVATAPVRSKVKAWKVPAILRRFSVLRSNKVVCDGPSRLQLGEWHLEPPERRVRVLDRDGEVLADVALGKKYDENLRFASPAGRQRVDYLEESKLEVLPAAPEDLLVPGEP